MQRYDKETSYAKLYTKIREIRAKITLAGN